MRYFIFGLIIGFIFFLIFIKPSLSLKNKNSIQFNHRIHKEAGIECKKCHEYFEEEKFSGMPKISTCMECHKDSITKNPEEEKIREFHIKGKELSWEKLYKQPDHVFFSHRRHVVIGKIDCKNCHGPIENTEKPPSKPLVNMTMKWCMDCHTKSKANNDCLACHV